MFGKFAVFFVVALCTTQVLSVQPEPRALQDIINSIKEIVQKIQTAINDIVGNIPNLIKNLNDKIQEIIDKINSGLEGIIDKINEQINLIISQANVEINAIQTCIDTEKSEVDQMIADTKDSIAKCKKVADDRVDKLVNEVEKLKTKASALIDEIKSGVNQCINDNGLNPVKLIKCMTDHLDNIKAKADALIKQIVDTVANANTLAIDITVTLAKCTGQISVDLISKQKQIVDNFQKCVDEVKEQQ